jgi:hypothetical protein
MIDFEESELIFGVANDIYKYCFVVLDFTQIYSTFPRELILSVEARQEGDKFVYENNSYINRREITLLKKPKIYSREAKRRLKFTQTKSPT